MPMTTSVNQQTTYSPAQARAAGIHVLDYPYENAPTGDVEAVFIGAVWGRSSSLRCLFETLDGAKFSIITFQNRAYKLDGIEEPIRYQKPGKTLALKV